jgi:transcriptional regulator with XRE-family HTH domain
MDFSLLNHLINESKMGKAQIAEAAKISRTTLDNALNGADMKISTVESLAKVLGVNPGVFFGAGNNAKVETNGDFSPASMHGNVTVGAEAVLAERVKNLEALLAEKERLIKVYEKLTEGR